MIAIIIRWIVRALLAARLQNLTEEILGQVLAGLTSRDTPNQSVPDHDTLNRNKVETYLKDSIELAEHMAYGVSNRDHTYYSAQVRLMERMLDDLEKLR